MRKLFQLSLAILAFASCQKNDGEPIINKSDYLPLEIGNYWIYEHYRVDAAGNEEKLAFLDSVYINRDTLIGSHQYFILEGYNYPFQIVYIVRDSAKYLVNNQGDILFSETNFTDTLAYRIEYYGNSTDTLFTLYHKMERYNGGFEVPAGTFNALNFKGHLKTFYYGQESPSTVTRNLNILFAPHVGKILHSYTYHSVPYITIEKRLVRYYVRTN